MPTKTTEHLLREHAESAQLLAAFRRYLKELEKSDTVDSREPSGLIDFLAECLFQRHEEKEESVLLPELARMGMSWSDGALARVRKEHRQGRYFLRSLRQAMRQGTEWSLDARNHFLSVAHVWVDFLLEHMLREEQVLFPFFDARLDDETDAQIVKQFEAIDRDYDEMPDAAVLQAAGDDFKRRYSSGRSSR